MLVGDVPGAQTGCIEGSGGNAVLFGKGGFTAGIVLSMGMALMLAACASNEPAVTDPVDMVESLPGYHDPAQVQTVKQGTQLRLVVFGAESLSGDHRVDQQGNLDLGSYGKVHVAGLTLPQVEEAINTRLREKGAPAARVTVMLVE